LSLRGEIAAIKRPSVAFAMIRNLPDYYIFITNLNFRKFNRPRLKPRVFILDKFNLFKVLLFFKG